MKEKLTSNLGLKMLAIFLAFFIWLIVINVSNPVVTRYLDVPVEVINEDILTKAKQTYEIVSKNTVTLSYEIRLRDAYKVSQSDFRVYADLAELYDVTGSVPVKIDVVNREIRSLIEGDPESRPLVIQIQTEDLQRKRFELQYRLGGRPEDGFAFGTTVIDPEYIYVSGPVSLVGQINSVGIEIEAENANDDLVGVAEPVFYDSNGNTLSLGERVEVNTNEISYQASILKVKNIGIDFETQGQVAEGYRFVGAESSIQTIPIMGRTSILANINTIRIPGDQLNLRGATGDLSVVVDLLDYLPEGVTVLEGTDTSATITLRVEALQNRTISVRLQQVEMIGALPDWEYNFEPAAIDVVVRGLEEELAQVSLSDLNLSIDVSNLTTGIYKGILNFNVGEGFEVISYSPFNINAAHEDGTEEPTTEEETQSQSQTESQEQTEEEEEPTSGSANESDSQVINPSPVTTENSGES